ncbi:alpha/beta fold hydrolase [Radiobacillus deserti]|uniref:Alpha/beta hydrolase n=1 Tax=Radiobacillus deserti TaxID=2594883 RepID=A0A516KKH3_9BACI|nr:alpha/beta hydrolase [Radiobacillus deserti]QDP41885.1 alpha/beta hydrolase [Radiobacillus deserti]
MQPNIQEHSAKIGTHTMFYRKAGSGSQTVVLMHGIPTNSFLWIEVIPRLAERFTVIAPDMIGYGKSSRASHEELTLPKQADHVRLLLDQLGVHEAHFIGHDLGSGVTQIFATKNPERVSSFVIIDGVAFSNWPLPKVVSLRYPTAPEFEPSPLFIERMMREGLLHQEQLTPELLKAMVEPFQTPSGPSELKEASLALEHHQTEEIVPQLKELTMPATILFGQYDRYLPPYWGLRLSETIPNATFKVLPDCSHYSMIDNPMVVVEEFMLHLEKAATVSV